MPRSLSVALVLLCTVVAASLSFLNGTPVGQLAVPAGNKEPLPRSEWTMYGGTPSRNMVNHQDKNVLRAFELERGFGLRWKAKLGSRSYAQPIVAGGRVFVGTNNEQPRNKRDVDKNGDPIDRGILMCFDASTGKFLWQAVHDKLPNGIVTDWTHEGVCSIPTVVGDRVYYVSNQCRVVCLDVNGFADGNQGFQGEKYKDPTDADIIWEYDMMKELKVFPHNMSTGCPLIIGDRLFVQTSNGVDETHINVPSPDAPSFICLDRNTGQLLWKDNAPGKNIMHGQWASPCYAAEPRPQVIFPGGDGWLRAFDPATGQLLWKFDCNPKDAKHELGGTGTRNDFIAAPVVHDGRLCIGTGQDPEHTTGIAHLWCLDVKKAVEYGAKAPNHDVSPELIVKVEKQPNGQEALKTQRNPSSALAWCFGGEDNRRWAQRDFLFGRTLNTVCVVDDLIYAAELVGYLHCLNAKTGKHYWRYDTKASIWGSPYYVDGRILLCNDNDLFVFRHDPKPEVIDEFDFAAANLKEARTAMRGKRREVEDKYLLMKLEFDATMHSTPSVAGGVIYLATEKSLYAIGP